MRYYVVEIASEPKDNMIEEREEIKMLIRDILDENYDIVKGETLRNILDSKMKTRFTSDERRGYFLSVDSMWRSDRPHMKSFFVGIQMKDRRPLHLFCQHRQLTSLREMAAWRVSRSLKTSQNFERLITEENIPKALTREIRNFFPNKTDENKNETTEAPAAPVSTCLTNGSRRVRGRGL